MIECCGNCIVLVGWFVHILLFIVCVSSAYNSTACTCWQHSLICRVCLISVAYNHVCIINFCKHTQSLCLSFLVNKFCEKRNYTAEP